MRRWEGLDVEISAELVEPLDDAFLYLAAYRSRLESRVTARNRGRILTHDYVVLECLGLRHCPAVEERHILPLVPGAGAANSGAAAFVQDRRTGAVLQALLRSTC